MYILIKQSEKLDMWKYKIEGLIRKIECQQNYSVLYGNQQPYRFKIINLYIHILI